MFMGRVLEKWPLQLTADLVETVSSPLQSSFDQVGLLYALGQFRLPPRLGHCRITQWDPKHAHLCILLNDNFVAVFDAVYVQNG